MDKKQGGSLGPVLALASSAPRVELLGKSFVVVDGYKSISRFEKEVIVLKAKKTIIEIRGFDLEIFTLSKSFIEIKGEILSVNLERGE